MIQQTRHDALLSPRLFLIPPPLPRARHNLNFTASNLAILLLLSLPPSLSCSTSPCVCLSSTLSPASDECFIFRAHLFTPPPSQSRVSPVIISPYSPSSPYRLHSSRLWNYMRFRWVPPPPPHEERREGGRESKRPRLGKDRSGVWRVGDCGAGLACPASPCGGPDLHLRCNYFVSPLPLLSPIGFASVVPPFHTRALRAHNIVVVPVKVALPFFLSAARHCTNKKTN